MNFLIFLHYGLCCLFGGRCLPRIIECNGVEWFSVCGYDKGQWFMSYSRHIEKTVTEELIEVRCKYKYFVYFRMLYRLWKMRDNIFFTIDSFDYE